MPQQSPNLNGERIFPSSIIDLSGGTVRALVISGGTIYSGGTDLGLIINSITGGGSGTQTFVQPGLNIITGGTANAPSINLSDTISLGSVSATTYFSGSTNIGLLLPQVGSESQVSGIAAAFTVTFATRPNNTYKVFITPTNSDTAKAFYVLNKTTTSFDVRFLTPPGGSTVDFDYMII